MEITQKTIFHKRTERSADKEVKMAYDIAAVGEIMRSRIDGEVYKVLKSEPDKTELARMTEADKNTSFRDSDPYSVPMVETGAVITMNDDELGAWFSRRSQTKDELAMEKIGDDLREGDVMINLFDGENYMVTGMGPDSITVLKVNEERDKSGEKTYAKARDAAPETVKGSDVAGSFHYLGPCQQRQLQDIEKMHDGSPKIAEYVKNTPQDKQGWDAMELAAKKSPASVPFMRENIQKTLIEDAVKRDPLIVKDLMKPPLDVQYEAVKANPYTVYLINNPHADVVRDAERRLDFEGIGITKISNLMKPQEREAMSNRRKVELAAGKGVKLPVKGVNRGLLRMTSRETLHKTDFNAVLANANKMAKADRAGNEQKTFSKNGQNFNR